MHSDNLLLTNCGIGKALMGKAWEVSPTSLFFGARPGRESFFEKLGYERSLASYARRKPRRVNAGAHAGEPEPDSG